MPEEITLEEYRALKRKGRARVKTSRGPRLGGSDGEAGLLFHIRSVRLPEPVPQYNLEGTRYRFDYAYPEHMLAIEVQGGIGSSQYHDGRQGYTDDCRRMAEAVIRGWRVMYVTTEMVENGEAVTLIERALAEHTAAETVFTPRRASHAGDAPAGQKG